MIAVIVALLLASVGFIVIQKSFRTDQAGQPSASRPTIESPTAAVPRGEVTPSVAVRLTGAAADGWTACVAGLAQVDRLVAAGVSAARSWQVYLQAQNGQRSGKLSAAVSSAQKQTASTQGARDVKVYRDIEASYVDVTDSCARAGSVKVPRFAQVSAQRCLVRVPAASAAVAAADVVVIAWKSHLEALQALNTGLLDRSRYEVGAAATYRKAPGQLAKFFGAGVSGGSSVEKLQRSAICDLQVSS